MSLRWAEGFDVRRASAYFTRLYASASSTPSGSTGRKIGFAGRSLNLSLITPALVGSATKVWYQHFAMRKVGVGDYFASSPGIRFRNSDGVQCSMVFINGDDGTGRTFKIQLRRGTATTIDTSGEFVAGAESPLGWHVFVLKVDVGDVGLSNGSYELRHFDYENNSTVVFSGSLVDLTDQGSAGVDRAEIVWDGGEFADYDDWLVWDDVDSPSGTVFQDSFPSDPFVILSSQPTADGNSSDWVPSSGVDHWALVDDNPGLIDDSSFVESDNIGDIDLFTYTALADRVSPTGTNLRAVVVDTMGAMQNSGQRTLQVRVRSGGLEADEGSGMTFDSLNLASLLRIMEQNPVTTSAWTVSSFDAAEIGVRLAS